MDKTTSSAGCRGLAALIPGASAGRRPHGARRRHRLAAVLACSAAALALAACSSASSSGAGSGSASSASGSGGASAASGGSSGASSSSGGSGSSGSLGSVTIGKAVDTIGFTTVDVAKAKGYFAKEGVTVNSELLSGSSTAFAALQSGGVNFVTASSTALIAAKAKGLPLEAIASLDYGVSLQLLVSNKWIKAHGISPSQPLATVMKKMVGAKLAVLSTTDLTYDHYLEEQAGLNSTQFTYIHIGSQSAALAAIKFGEVDAFLLSPPSTYYAQSQGGATIVASLHEVPTLANMAYDILVVDSNWAQSHAAQVKAVATAMAMADNAMSSDPASVVSVEQQHYPTMNSSVLLNSLKAVTFTQNGTFSQDMWTKALTEYQSTTKNAASGVSASSGSGVWTNQYIQTAGL